MTYIFRFRDLGKEDGFTIEQHNLIATAHGYVWWGWWAKAGELFPKHELEAAVEESGVKIFLFDSGRSKFYQTTLTEVHASPSGKSKVSSPDSCEKTPSYYNSNQLYGWLKISEITEISEDLVLKEYSYEPLNDMYPSGLNDPDEQLFGKLVYSSRELIKQDRTIWKVRTKRADDYQHESLATHYKPYNFIRKYSQRESDFIVWLSDIHFDNGQGKHSFPFEDSAQRKSLSTRVLELIDKYSPDSKCAGLAISGDITWQSQPEGFTHAREFIKHLRSSQGLTPDDIIICPGNHDVGLVSREEYYENINQSPSEDDWNQLATEYHENSMRCYVDFYRDIFLREPEINLAQGRKFLLGGHKVVEVAAINSCVLQQVKNTFQGIGYIGEDQLKLVAKKMGWVSGGTTISKKSGVVRIVMLHHHLTPVNEVEDAFLDTRYSVTLDAERLMRWIVTHKVDYVLHGHMHRCNSITITRSLDPLKKISEQNPEHTFKIVSLGSSGVVNSELPITDSFNYVCIIDFSSEQPKFNFYKLNNMSATEKEPSYDIVG